MRHRQLVKDIHGHQVWIYVDENGRPTDTDNLPSDGAQRNSRLLRHPTVLAAIITAIASFLIAVYPTNSSNESYNSSFKSIIVAIFAGNTVSSVSTPTPDGVIATTHTTAAPTQTVEPNATIPPNNTVLPSQSPQTLIPLTPSTPISVAPTASLDLSANCPPLGSPDAIFSQAINTFGDVVGSVGTNVFENAVRPFGFNDTTYIQRRDAMIIHNCYQFLSPVNLYDPQATRQCLTSLYNTNMIWFGSVKAGITLFIRASQTQNYTQVGVLQRVAADARSYLLQIDLKVGDEICVEAPSGMTLQQLAAEGGYHIWFGRDLTIFTDSWCRMRDENDVLPPCNG